MGRQASLVQVVAGVLEVDPAAVVDELGPATFGSWTSRKHIELVMALEELYGLRFTHEEITGLRSVKDLREVLNAKGVAP